MSIRNLYLLDLSMMKRPGTGFQTCNAATSAVLVSFRAVSSVLGTMLSTNRYTVIDVHNMWEVPTNTTAQ
jgi:hypothetical protein